MNRVEQYHHVQKALKDMRLSLGLKQCRRSDYWASMDDQRKAGYLKRANRWACVRQDINLDWYEFRDKERWAIEQAINGACRRAMDDCYAMGVGVPTFRREAE